MPKLRVAGSGGAEGDRACDGWAPNTQLNRTREWPPEPITEVVGVGFGPSNLALAIALQEHNAMMPDQDVISAEFFERQPRFGWHRDMLISGSTMQVSFLKDLTTMRNPTSEYGFLSYLQDKERLADFINHKILYPSRVEFHDYLEWVAAKFEHVVEYDVTVTMVRPVVCDGVVSYFDVVCEHGGASARRSTRRTRNVVLAMGLEPRVPPGVVLSDRVWHSSELLGRIDQMRDRDPRRLTVIGAGQSAAEVTEYLHRTFPRAEVCAVFSRYGYSVADDSPFANRIFDPAAVDDFFVADPDIKAMLLGYHSNTNYSVVDLDLIQELYRRVYQERVTGERRLRVLNVSQVRAATPSAAGVRLTVEFLPTGVTTTIDSDIVVYATGYQPMDPLRVLGELGEFCKRDPDGKLLLKRDYRVVTSGDVQAGIYLQGATEHTHGIATGLLSNTAVRAGEIVRWIADGYARRLRPAEPTGCLPDTTEHSAVQSDTCGGGRG